MPRYQPGEETTVVMVMVDSPAVRLRFRLCLNWKKPSANLPFLETSLSPAASAWPAARVSPIAVAAELGACSEEKKMRPSSVT